MYAMHSTQDTQNACVCALYVVQRTLCTERIKWIYCNIFYQYLHLWFVSSQRHFTYIAIRHNFRFRLSRCTMHNAQSRINDASASKTFDSVDILKAENLCLNCFASEELTKLNIFFSLSWNTFCFFYMFDDSMCDFQSDQRNLYFVWTLHFTFLCVPQ